MIKVDESDPVGGKLLIIIYLHNILYYDCVPSVGNIEGEGSDPDPSTTEIISIAQAHTFICL